MCKSASPRRALVFACALLFATTAPAQQEADELAKQLSNPVASLISVPFQYNVDFNVGPSDGTLHKLNIQPVIPTSISQDWNLITRVIAPVISQDDVYGDSGSQFGLGDITPSLFFSPKKPTSRGWIFGIGPVFLLPTATDDLLGTEKWGVGPTVLALRQTSRGWTYGALVNHIRSVAGNSHRNDVNSTFLQPFVSRQFSRARTVSLNAEATYDWEGGSWSVPLNLGYSKVTQWGEQKLSWQAGVRYYAETPDDGSNWGLRFVLTFLFPERR